MHINTALPFAVLLSMSAAINAQTNAQMDSTLDSVQLSLTGERFTMSVGERQLLNDGRKLNLSFFPDQTTVVLARENELASEPELRVLTANSNSTFLLEGTDWKSLNRARKVLEPVDNSSYDNGYAGIAGVFSAKGGRLYAIYHAEDHIDIPRFASGIPGYYATVAMAYSDDAGATWSRLGPVIKSSKDKHWEKYPGQSDRGVGEPSMVIDKTGKWIYVYYTEHARINSTGVHIGMARASTAFKPGTAPAFYKLKDRTFDQPGLGGLDSPIIRFADPFAAEGLNPHVMYLPRFDTYLMTLSVNYWDDYLTDRGLTDSGIYVSMSRDGVIWSDPKMLFRDYTVPVFGKTLSWGATLIVDIDSSEQGWMVYGYSPHWGGAVSGGTPHHLVGRRFRITRR